MTPVQLPEVPEPFIELITHAVYDAWAAQLRAYATEAVMAERARLMLRVDAWRYEAKIMERSTYEGALDYRDALTNCADDIAPLLDTQPEQNSGR